MHEVGIKDLTLVLLKYIFGLRCILPSLHTEVHHCSTIMTSGAIRKKFRGGGTLIQYISSGVPTRGVL